MAKENAGTGRKSAAPNVAHRHEEVPYSRNVRREWAPLRIRSDFGFSQEEFGRLVGISTRKISSLETSKQSPSLEDVRRVTELSRLHAELSQVIEASAIPSWMKTPNEYFDGLSPMEVVQRGESDRIYRMAWRLQEGIPLD